MGSASSGFTEVAEGCWVSRQAWFDVNVSLVRGEAGPLVVDTHASSLAARRVLAEIRDLLPRLYGGREVRPVAVVNTHEHFDHTFGNAAFAEQYENLSVIAHEEAAARTLPAGERIKQRYAEDADDPHRQEVLDTPVLPAGQTFSSVRVVDLGDRIVELVHPGRGHTGGDLVLRVPDADVVLAGDLVEESAERGSVPGFGEDCYPLEWPTSLDLVLGLTGPDTVVVPGHGAPVDQAFVADQHAGIGRVAEQIRELAGRGISVGDALAAGEWPYPSEALTWAVRRGYAQLGPGERQLPRA